MLTSIRPSPTSRGTPGASAAIRGGGRRAPLRRCRNQARHLSDGSNGAARFAPASERSLDTDVNPELARLADPAKRPDEALAAGQVEHALEQAIGALEPLYREVLLLRDVEGLTAPEVAEVLVVSVQAVKSRLHRARLSVRAHVARQLGIPGGPHRRTTGGVPRCAHLVFAAPRGRHQRGRLCRDGAAPRSLWPLPRCLRLAQADARALPQVGPLRRGARVGQGRPAKLPRRERLNPLASGRLSPVMEAICQACR